MSTPITINIATFITHNTKIQLQLYHNNSFPTIMQFPYDYNHNVMLMSFFIIHQILTCGNMKKFGEFFFEILISIIHYDYSFWMILDYDMWHNQNLPHDILIEFRKNYILYKYLGRLIHCQK
jgi:hypothetical protein